MTSKCAWLPGVAALLSMLACYGTLVIAAILGAFGVVISTNEIVWADVIVAFALIAICGLALGFSRHRQVWPVLVGGLGAAVLGYTMYIDYSRLTEVSAFILLCVATIGDWRLLRACRRAVPIAK